MIAQAIEALRCPLCRQPFSLVPGALRCGAGHAFDLARQGYVNLLAGRPGGGDTADMVAARARWLGAGHYAPLAAAVAAAAAPHAGLAVEIGAGTAYYLAAVLDAAPEATGLALDVSIHAARRAARAHPRAAAAVVDAATELPLADRSAGVVLSVFAPRNVAEIARILDPAGALVIATPAGEHLGELRAPLGLLEVDPDKERRLAERLANRFDRGPARALTFTLTLDHAAIRDAVAMGPSAFHLAPGALDARIAGLPEPLAVTCAFKVEVDRPR